MPPRPRPWFRLYTSILTSRKVQRLKPPLFKHWVNFMALAGENNPRGTLPCAADIAFRLNISEDQAANALEELVALHLVDQNGDAFVMHEWDDWQKDRDVPPAKREGKSRVNHAIDAERHAISADTTPLITDQSRVLYIEGEEEEEKDKEEDKEREAEGDARARRPLHRLFEQCFGRLLSPMEIEQINALIEEHPYERIEYGLREASELNKRSVRYIQRVCEGQANGNSDRANHGVPASSANPDGVARGLSDVERRRAFVAQRG